MILENAIEEILKSAELSLKNIPREQVQKTIDLLVEAKGKHKKIMVIGVGRSGLVARAFAMRLMHLGFRVYVVGETITPALNNGDILFAISGSGETTFVVAAAEIAKRVGGTIIALTSFPESKLGKLAQHVIHLPGRVKTDRSADYFSRQILGEHEPLLPLGTLFEISSMIFLDSLIIELMHRIGETEERMKARHATIE